MRKVILLVLVFAMLLSTFGVLTGCDSQTGKSTTTTGSTAQTTAKSTEQSAKPVDITYALWATGDDLESILKIADKYNESQKNIKVTVEGVDPTVYWQKLNAAFASNTAADVIQVAADYGDAFISRGVFSPIDSYVTSDLKTKWPQSLLDSLKVDDKLYALPRGTQVYFIAYNKKLFDEAGVEYPTKDWTEEEFLDKAKKLTDPSKNQYGVLVTGYPKDLVRNLYGNNCYDWTNKKMLAEGNEDFKRALNLLVVDLFHTYKVTPQSVSKKDLGGGFETGRYPMAFIAYWDLSGLATTIGDTFEWDIVQYPMNSETKIRWKSPLYVQALSIYSKSEKKDAAFEFMKWMATDRYAQTNSLGSFPVCNDILSDPSFLTEFPAGEKYDKTVVIKTIEEQGIAWWNTGVVGDINDNIISPEIEKLILKPNETSVEQLIKTVQTKGQEKFDASK